MHTDTYKPHIYMRPIHTVHSDHSNSLKKMSSTENSPSNKVNCQELNQREKANRQRWLTCARSHFICQKRQSVQESHTKICANNAAISNREREKYHFKQTNVQKWNETINAREKKLTRSTHINVVNMISEYFTFIA